MFKGQRSKCQKLQITSSVIVTDIPIKTQQFPASSFWVACYRFFAAVTLILGPWPWTYDLETKRDLDILKMCLQTENEVARSNHSNL